eukprot:4275555-Amphidinium_carterae.1
MAKALHGSVCSQTMKMYTTTKHLANAPCGITSANVSDLRTIRIAFSLRLGHENVVATAHSAE